LERTGQHVFEARSRGVNERHDHLPLCADLGYEIDTLHARVEVGLQELDVDSEAAALSEPQQDSLSYVEQHLISAHSATHLLALRSPLVPAFPDHLAERVSATGRPSSIRSRTLRRNSAGYLLGTRVHGHVKVLAGGQEKSSRGE
jgi:hypothetical protein